jgi:hypothetical protein
MPKGLEADCPELPSPSAQYPSLSFVGQPDRWCVNGMWRQGVHRCGLGLLWMVDGPIGVVDCWKKNVKSQSSYASQKRYVPDIRHLNNSASQVYQMRYQVK